MESEKKKIGAGKGKGRYKSFERKETYGNCF
jgi:hypothetical protein